MSARVETRVVAGEEAFVAPMSFAQQRLWFLERLQPHTSAYNETSAWGLRGSLEVEALGRAVSALVARHESLRTTFASRDGEPVQVIAPALEVPVEVETLTAGAAGERGRDASVEGEGPGAEVAKGECEAAIARWVRAVAGEAFDLERGPLLRVRVLRVAEGEQVLVLVIHHIVSDGWSMGVLWRELSELYGAYARGEEPRLAELPIQYADYALWQRERLSGLVLERELGYWRERLAGLSPLELPTDRLRPAVQSYRGGVERFALGPELTAALKGLARSEGVTLYMVLLAGFALLLGRYSGQADVALGSPIAGRNRRELEGLIGFFVNTLVLRVDLGGEPTFRELLGRVREVALGAYEHQELPFERLVEELAPERDLSRNPLVQVLFSLQNMPTAEPRLGALQAEPLATDSNTAKFDLTLLLTEVEGGLKGRLSYATDLFEAASVERMVGHYRRLLEDVVADRGKRISELEILTDAERRRLIEEWNATSAPFPVDRCIHHLFEEQVARDPHALAVRCGDRRLSYAQLNGHADRLAAHLQSRGVGPESLVGVLLDRSPELLVAVLGILKAGGAYVPLDPAYPQSRLAFMLKDAQACLLVTKSTLCDRAGASVTETVCLDAEAWASSTPDAPSPDVRARPENPAYVIYTSGSTGRPKGVAIEHRSVVGLIAWALELFRPSDLASVLASTSVCFDLSVFELFVTLASGGTVVLVDSVLALPELPADAGVTLVNTVPSAMAELLRLHPLPASVRVVNLAGEPLKQSLVDAIYQHGTVERVYDLYGPTEDTVYSTAALRVAGGRTTIGRPIANTKAFILDRNLRPVPIGVPGEICLTGLGLARGYLGRPELTAERFVEHPLAVAPRRRLYRTGDQARFLPDGRIALLGRMDNQVKLRGFRIELGEIEAVLLAHPGVRDAVVAHREDLAGDGRLVGYVVAAPGVQVQAMRTYLESRLPGYMVPSALVVVDRLPRTPNGKVDRKALPDPVSPHEAPAVWESPSRTTTQELVTGIWAEVLGVDRPGLHDNFFELGGHSLRAIQVVSRVRDALGLEVPLRAAFERPTIAAFAERLSELLAAEDAVAHQDRRQQSHLMKTHSSAGLPGHASVPSSTLPGELVVRDISR